MHEFASILQTLKSYGLSVFTFFFVGGARGGRSLRKETNGKLQTTAHIMKEREKGEMEKIQQRRTSNFGKSLLDVVRHYRGKEK